MHITAHITVFNQPERVEWTDGRVHGTSLGVMALKVESKVKDGWPVGLPEQGVTWTDHLSNAASFVSLCWSVSEGAPEFTGDIDKVLGDERQ